MSADFPTSESLANAFERVLAGERPPTDPTGRASQYDWDVVTSQAEVVYLRVSGGIRTGPSRVGSLHDFTEKPFDARVGEEMIYVRTAYREIMTEDDELATSMVDREAVTRVLQAHPVRVGVLFGSHVRGTETTDSDVDVAVEFDESLSRTERHEARLDLIVDLMETLGVNDVDVTDLDDVRPAVGASALRTGVVLVDEEARVDRLLDAFEAETTDRSHEERMRQFDELLARLEEAV